MEQTYATEGARALPLSGLARWASAAGELGREVWRHLPAWLFFFYACFLLNTELTNLEPARPDLAYTAVFPIGVFLLYYGTRAAFAPDVRRRGLLFGVSCALLVLPLATVAYHRPSPIEPTLLLALYELSNLFWAGLLAFHAYRQRRTWAALFFGVALVYGFLLENGGIVLGFFFETNLTLTAVHPFPAPLATVLGWSVVLYLGTFVVWTLRSYFPALRRSALASALGVAVVSTLLDLQVDPLATATGCWVWHPSLPGWFHGVPLVNFLAWLCALFPFAYVQFRLQERLGIGDDGEWTRGQLARLLLYTPATLGLSATCFLLFTLLAEGPSGPSWTLMNGWMAQVFAVLGFS